MIAISAVFAFFGILCTMDNIRDITLGQIILVGISCLIPMLNCLVFLIGFTIVVVYFMLSFLNNPKVDDFLSKKPFSK